MIEMVSREKSNENSVYSSAFGYSKLEETMLGFKFLPERRNKKSSGEFDSRWVILHRQNGRFNKIALVYICHNIVASPLRNSCKTG